MNDKQERQEFLFSLMNLSGNLSVLDLGCGKGQDLLELGRRLGPDAHIVGVDSAQKAMDASRELVSGDPRFDLVMHDISQGLQFEDESFDLVYSMNMLECIPDKDALVREIHRVLKQGGQVVCAHHDFDSMLLTGTDKDLVRKLVHTFGDWKQAWMTDCDSWMGRRLWGVFSRSGLFSGKVHAHVQMSTEYDPDDAGWVGDFGALVKRGMISQEEYDRFTQDLKALAARGEYFFSINLFAYVGTKV